MYDADNRVMTVMAPAAAERLLRGGQLRCRSELRGGWYYLLTRASEGSPGAGSIVGRISLGPPVLEETCRAYPVQQSMTFPHSVLVMHKKEVMSGTSKMVICWLSFVQQHPLQFLSSTAHRASR